MSKLNQSHQVPNIPQFTPLRTDRTHKQGEGRLTYTKTTSVSLNLMHQTSFQVNYKSSKSIFQHHSNYISQTCKFHPAITNRRRLNYIQMLKTITNLPNTIITADVNAHSPLWYSQTQDHREELIENIQLNSHHIKLSTNTATRLPHNQTQQPTSSDITTGSADLHDCTNL